MELVKQGGVKVENANGTATPFHYKCPMDAGTRETPGPCPICKMELNESHKVPAEAASKERTIYVCDVHPEEVFDKPGQCFKDT